MVGSITSIPTDPFNNETSTRDTVEEMARIAIEQAQSPIILRVVEDLQLTNLSPWDQCLTIYSFVRRTLTFKEDEIQLALDGHHPSSELLRTPEYLLTIQPEGDCDDYSLLTATLLLAGTNLGVAFGTIKTRDDRPMDWSHIYVVAVGPGGPIAMDCSHGPYVGWEMPDKFVRVRKYWKVRE